MQIAAVAASAEEAPKLLHTVDGRVRSVEAARILTRVAKVCAIVAVFLIAEEAINRNFPAYVMRGLAATGCGGEALWSGSRCSLNWLLLSRGRHQLPSPISRTIGRGYAFAPPFTEGPWSCMIDK